MTKLIKGFIILGARPFHKGHEALIEYGKSNCDHLTILVGAVPNEPIDIKYRLHWVLSNYLHDSKVSVFGDYVVEPNFINSAEKSIWWGKYVTKKWGKFDRVFTSEDYGTIFSETLGAENWVFNKSRTIVPISGTMIRNKPFTNWEYINNFAKDYFVKKIFIVGTESTGKTTLAKQLAEYYNTTWCRELGRDLIPDTKKCTIDDLRLVGIEHAKEILRQTRKANKILFVDTDLNITKSYSKYLFNEIPEYPDWVEEANKSDLTLFLSSQYVPFIQDGTRLIEEDREKLEENHKEILSEGLDKEDNYEILHFPNTFLNNTKRNGYECRFKEATKIIDEFIKQF